MPIDGLRPVLQANRLWWNDEFAPPQVPPKAWLFLSSASLETHHWIVRFSTGSFRSGPPAGFFFMWRYSDRFSSRPQLAET